MKILVINSGSSSIKYKLYDAPAESELASGLVERIGETGSVATHTSGSASTVLREPVADYGQAILRITQLLTTFGEPPPLNDPRNLAGVGHRVVHGGEAFAESVLVDPPVLAAIEACSELAPLHNPANLAGITASMKIMPGKPQVAVFDTAFFQTMPPAAYHYAIPYAWYERYRIRRYGFHGTSHRYVALRAAAQLGKSQPNLITMHLGNGCSMACIRAGVAIDQSMGLTPLEGLVMGTRCGDLDPAIIFRMIAQGMPPGDVQRCLEKESGLLGLSGRSRDLRDVMKVADTGDERARLALNVFAHRARKYVGAFLAELGTCDAVIMTGGIGEHASAMRARIFDGMDGLGLQLDPIRNDQHTDGERCISAAGSKTPIWVIPTNEELMIARETVRLIS